MNRNYSHTKIKTRSTPFEQ